MPFPPLWSFLFFTMLITLGLDSQFTMVETITTAIMDQWPATRAHKGKVVILSCIVGFLLGLTCCTRGGIFMFTLIDWYASSWGLLICAFLEVLVVIYLYGPGRFLSNIEEMGIRLSLVMKGYWLLCWVFLTPATLVLVFVMTFIHFSPAESPQYSQETYIFPDNIQILGFVMSFSPLAIILIGALVQIIHRLRQGQSVSVSALTSTGEDWGPAESPKKTTTMGVSNMSFVSEILGGPPHVNISYLTDETSNVSITKYRNISVL